MHTDMCHDSDLVRLLSGTGETVVAQHCSDWNQDLEPAISRACGVRCSPLSHSGQTAADSSLGPRHHSPKHARPQGRVLYWACAMVRARQAGSPLFYINTWAMVWPNDYPALAT